MCRDGAKTMSKFDLEGIPWDRTRHVDTRMGRRRVREWNIPKDSPFWRLWNSSKAHLKQLGYVVSKWQGEWMLTEWRLPKGDQPESAVRAAMAVQSSQATQRRMELYEPELPPYLELGFLQVWELYQLIKQNTGEDFTYQLPSIKRLVVSVEAFDGALDASDTGIGKTFVACGVAKVLNRSIFVVCPKSVIPPWKRAAYLFGVEAEVINYEMLRTGNTPWGYWTEKGRGRVFTYRGIDGDQVLFVFDECHRMKDSKTLQSKLGIAALNQHFKVLALSATAADNPMHMKFVALLTGLIPQPSHFMGWMAQNGVRPGKWGLEFVGGHEVLSRIHKQIFPSHGSRIKIADLGDRFPQTRIISESYDMGDATTHQIQAVYREMREEIDKLERRRAQDGAFASANILTQMLRARQRVELLKVPTLVQMGEDGLAEDMAVVVILNFDDSIQAVTKRLNTTNTITGEDKPDQRQALIDAFNADEEQIIVMNIKAGGLGIGLHGTSQGRARLVLLSPTFSGIDLKQALGRCHRAGGAFSIQKIVWAANTVEEKACQKVRARIQRVSIFNDDEIDESLKI
jgi:Mimiviridae putative ATP-dependent RNA helicase